MAPQLGDCGTRRKNKVGKGRGNKMKGSGEERKEKRRENRRGNIGEGQ